MDVYPLTALGTGLLVAALVVEAALTTACRGGAASTASASVSQVTISAHDTMRFEPPTINAQVGQPVQVKLVNDGTLIHDFVLTQGVAQPVKIEANGKASASGTLTITQPGTYTYVCAQPGHEAAGMKRTIVAR